MSMVEPGICWDAVANGVLGDEEFENILSILDFPIETLEGDGFVEDWDISKSQCLGPIPSNVLIAPLMDPPTGPNRKLNTGPVTPNPLKIGGALDQNHLSNHIEASSVFQTQSPVSVLESNGSCSGRKTLPVKSQPAIPARTRSKRVRPTGVNPWLLISPLSATSPKKRDKERRNNNIINNKRSSQLPISLESTNDSSQKVETLPHHHRPAVVKKCTHCEVTKTPQWREGPLGPKTLCNACGVRYRSGRLFPEYRPAASPTFVPTLHSNSHKKVIEMRNKPKDVVGSKIEENPTSPQPEFVPMSSYLFDYIY